MNTNATSSFNGVNRPVSTPTTKKPRKRRMARQVDTGAKSNAATSMAPDAKPAAAASPKSPSKIGSVVALLERSEGTTLAEMVEATGWLPHTTRAALTGLRKKGRKINKAKVDGVTRYTTAAVAQR